MIRHARMRGHPTLFLPGLDHASIAAQFVLDGILAKEGEDRRSLGRERYLERMRAFSDSTKPVMLGQQRRVGGSFDWGRLRYTMDEGSAKAVRVAFERLYRDDLAYRTEALVNWCPGCRTSVSDLEVVATPETGHALVDPLPPHRRGDRESPDPDATITIATTRPETLLGDTAVAVHPDDPRYRRARRASRPHPVRRARRADHRRRGGRPGVRDGRGQDHAGPRPRRPRDRPPPRAAGAHDPRRRRHDRRDRDRRTTGSTGSRRGGGSSPTSRPRGDLAGSAAHEMVVGRCQRSDDIVEPRLKTQWFIRTGPLAARALDATRSGRTRILPGPLREDLGALADRHPRLERQPPAVVGPSHPGVVLPGRARDGLVAGGRARRLRRPAAGRRRSSSRTPTSSTPGSAPGCGRSRPSAGPTTRPTTGASTRPR